MRPNLIRTAAPAALPVDKATVWTHLAALLVETGDSPPMLAPEDSAYIDELIDAAVDRLDGPFGLLNRALITQEWAARYSGFLAEITVPLARCQSVESIVYLDSAGEEQTLATSAYRVTGLNTDQCRIRPVNGTAWPSTYLDPEAVTLNFISGFGDEYSEVPASIRRAIFEMVATSYEHRESAIAGATFSSLPYSAQQAAMDWTVFTE